MNFLVIRKAVLQEDEGRVTPIKVFFLKANATAWIEKQEGEFFKPGDYYVERIGNINGN